MLIYTILKPMKRILFTLFPLSVICIIVAACSTDSKIDRKALVARHRVIVTSIDTLTPLTVGNGKFAYTADFTGLQSFPGLYEKGIPLGTQSEWGWHSFPDSENFTFEETLENFSYYDREIPYSVQIREPERKRNAVNYFRMNPHRLHLGIVGLEILNSDGTAVDTSEISSIRQVLDPWTGEIHSSFVVSGEKVEVTTYCHPDSDIIAAKIRSPLVSAGKVKVNLAFAYPSGQHSDSGCDWGRPEYHFSELTSFANRATIFRKIDNHDYFVGITWEGAGELKQTGKHTFLLEPGGEKSELVFSCWFTPEPPAGQWPGFEAASSTSKKSWEAFWKSGGAVDLSGSTDPRAEELERRIVLSQYLTRAQCTGDYPPQETGLTYNSWYGKFHLEMHYWHGIHFPLWGRDTLLSRSFGYYQSIRDKARSTAERQGFEGIRWPKMTDPRGNDSPSGVGSFLIWQQPHLIYMAELCYRNSGDESFLARYSDLVFETAEFMASYAHFDGKRYVLGPRLIPAQESHPAATTINPPFELAYWQWGLETAQQWKKRLGEPPVAEWDSIARMLSQLPVKDGIYLAAESAPDSYTNPRFMSDHPMVTGTYGMLPNSKMIDPAIMKSTFDTVWNKWHWTETWGWDFPMTAMAATRLGMPERTIDALFMDVETNTYLPNGHNYQDKRLRLYLPGNGALLTSVALMCAGWDGSAEENPGFPKDGKWKVRWEGLKKLP
jgi:protein-glucosylgalactosylhydroxylysine glucosidase